MTWLYANHCVGMCVIGATAALLAPPVPLSGSPQVPVTGTVQVAIEQPLPQAKPRPKPESDQHSAAEGVQKSKNSEKPPRLSPLVELAPKTNLIESIGFESADENVPPYQFINQNLPSLVSSPPAPEAIAAEVLSQAAVNNLLSTELQKPEPIEAIKPPVTGTANRIVVPSIEVDIAVQPGVYDSVANSWKVDDSAAFHADTTVPVNDTNGTTLIYGHAKWGIFGALPDLTVGDEATVFTSEGIQFVYVLESIRQVDPTDVSMLTPEGAPQLILQTCSGLFDQHRTLAVFNLKEMLHG